MVDRPTPPVPAACDLQDFEFMPLDVARLRDSEIAALDNAEAFRAAVMSWCAAWHQIPAGSLPNEDAALCRLLGYGRDLRTWKKLRDAGALRGWVECSDGRLYHFVVAEKARIAWDAKCRNSARINRRLCIESGEWAAIRSQIFARDDYTCRYCGKRGVELECDHIVPVSRGGDNSESNLVTACRRCNRAKGAKTLGEWV